MSENQNIVLISWDSVRADQLPMYGYERQTTPYLAEIAEDGLVFDDTHVTGVGTPTSFTGAFTGEHAHAVQANIDPEHWRESNAGRRLLSEALQDAGYTTGAIHANALMSRYYGWNRGWNTFKDHLWTEGGDTEQAQRWSAFKKTTVLPLLRKYNLAGPVIHAKNILLDQPAYASWEDLWGDVQAFVEEAPEPWFLWVLLVDTHHPWTAPDEYQAWPQPGRRVTNGWNYVMRRYPEFTGTRKPIIVNAYDNELRHADAFLRRFDELLEAHGYGDVPTIVHSDHGDELGEHDDYGHAPAMWDTVTRVPLVMRNVGETGRVDGPVTLKDLGSTVLDLAGSDERLNDRPSLLGSEREDREHVYVENRTMDGDRLAAAVGRDGWKVIRHADGTLEAYHRTDDPYEQRDRYGEHPTELEEWLHAQIARREQLAAGEESTGGESDLDASVQERLTELGYID
ncbi:sulfatase-like hydrolase/transferase [Halobacteriaceae archaeon GCM10025711]